MLRFLKARLQRTMMRRGGNLSERQRPRGLVDLALPLPGCFLDNAAVDPVGMLRLTGWSTLPSADIRPLDVTINGQKLAFARLYRYVRPDVPAGPDLTLRQSGLVLEYQLPASMPGAGLELAIEGHSFPLPECPTIVVPPYDHLLTTERVLGRDDIYGFGPPMSVADPEIVDLVAGLSGRVLDFGCGSGALVRALRQRGVDAWGVEIDRGPIRDSLGDDVRPFITLYHGEFPLPFADQSFDGVVCTEVLEHIPDFRTALSEMVRVARRSIMLTVPDIEVLPRMSRHGVVPWHLLESTHINFFTQRSLAAELGPHVAAIEFGRISRMTINGDWYDSSLVAVATKAT